MTTDASRATRTRFAAALALAGWMCGALAQQAGDGGMIVIPGRGESAETALANANAANAHGANAGGAGAPAAAGWNGSGNTASAGRWNAQAAAQAAAAWNGRSGAPSGAGSNDPANASTAADRSNGQIVIDPGPPASNSQIAASPATGWKRPAIEAAPRGEWKGQANPASTTAGSNLPANAAPASPQWNNPAGATAPATANRSNPAASAAAGVNPAFRAVAASRAPANAQQVATVVAQDAAVRAGRPANTRAAAQPWQAQRAQGGVIPVSFRSEPAPSALPARPAPIRTAAPAANAPGAQTTAAPAASANATASAPVPAGQQDGETIRRAALAFLQQQAAGLPGKTTVTVAPAFPRGLAACTTLEPFLPSGARLWGRTTVGVRCAGERPWTIYLQAKLAVQATYYVAARQISPGEALSAADLIARDGDLTMLPLAVITDPTEAVGATALTRVAAGLPLRRDLLKSAASVSIGQTVRVVASGQGFTISAEGSVLNNAAPGQQVRVRMAAGQIVTAIVKDAATVEIPL
ncbi:flagellar basal body P-ring formation chaperone FlgA [Burkholderia mayonis]|uniref:Flagellar biosynthesis protein FlgA n=1 Tax=Burkholderia mayonis TaxID=1385591 RepID=A0A1B4G6I7_9BURK|nr:flagellar basal body P-ring formation chaperone FlgA [Burkholderia mayonis]AOJ11537.1 flagellar biosynthesis protein FlgA [Burkholderia mayonis]KVE46511.1 flagellar biosynthesis protein FlgA [Burkholderia mayonis]